MAMNYKHTRFDSLMLAILLFAAVRQTNGEEFQLPPYPDVVHLPVSIDGKNHDFLLDSGASTVFVHTSIMPELGKAVGEHRVNGFDSRWSYVPFYKSPQADHFVNSRA